MNGYRELHDETLNSYKLVFRLFKATQQFISLAEITLQNPHLLPEMEDDVRILEEALREFLKGLWDIGNKLREDIKELERR